MVNRPIKEQEQELIVTALLNPNIHAILNGKPFPKTSNWYLGAGCVCQSVWNHLLGNEITQGIDDYDLVYYDDSDLSKASETKEQERINELFAKLPARIEVINEARVHLWFEEDFGKKIEQLQSAEDAINQWPTTATAVGINKVGQEYSVYAPYGLNDLFGLVVRPNKPYVLRHVYEHKVEKWSRKWPRLKVLSWEQI